MFEGRWVVAWQMRFLVRDVGLYVPLVNGKDGGRKLVEIFMYL